MKWTAARKETFRQTMARKHAIKTDAPSYKTRDGVINVELMLKVNGDAHAIPLNDAKAIYTALKAIFG